MVLLLMMVMLVMMMVMMVMVMSHDRAYRGTQRGSTGPEGPGPVVVHWRSLG
jgi:hypothetical protein